MPANLFKRSSIRRYDIRGRFGSEITLTDAYFYGSAFAHYSWHHDDSHSTKTTEFAAGKLYIGWDERPSSGAMVEALTLGFSRTYQLFSQKYTTPTTETHIELLGNITSPFLYFCANYLNKINKIKEKSDFLIIVTASHNTTEYNGFKILFGTKCLDGAEINKILDNYSEYLLNNPITAQIIKNYCPYSTEFNKAKEAKKEAKENSAELNYDKKLLPKASLWSEIEKAKQAYIKHLSESGWIDVKQNNTENLPDLSKNNDLKNIESACNHKINIAWHFHNSFLGELLTALTPLISHCAHTMHTISINTPEKANLITKNNDIINNKAKINLLYNFDADADRFSLIWLNFPTSAATERQYFTPHLAAQHPDEHSLNLTLPGDWVLACLAWQQKQQIHGKYEEKSMILLADVKSSRVVLEYLAQIGYTVKIAPTGHSLIKNFMQQCGAIIAGEPSGHFYFSYEERLTKLGNQFIAENTIKNDHTLDHSKVLGVRTGKNAKNQEKMLLSPLPYDDALLAALRLTKLLTMQEGREFAQKIYSHFAASSYLSPEFKFSMDNNEARAIIMRLKGKIADKNQKNDDLLINLAQLIGYNFIDGIRYDQPGVGWWLLRASNSEPVLVFRYEFYRGIGAKKQELYDKLINLLEYAPEIKEKILLHLK